MSLASTGRFEMICPEKKEKYFTSCFVTKGSEWSAISFRDTEKKEKDLIVCFVTKGSEWSDISFRDTETILCETFV